jgi:hypothetical protein
MRHLIPVVLLVAAGCASPSGMHWMKEDIHPVAVRGDRRLDRARIWSGDSVLHWRAVLITRDSISGIPDQVSLQCDSCRLTLPTSVVDSLRVGYPARGGDRGGAGPGEGTDFLLITLIILGTLFSP